MKPTTNDLKYLATFSEWRTEGIQLSGININTIAAKLRALRALEYPAAACQLSSIPRLRETLLFLQWMSHQPGGMERSVHQMLLIPSAEHIGTAALHAVQPTKEGRFRSLKEMLTVWSSIPERAQKWVGGLTERHRDSFNLWLMEDDDRLRAIEREAGPHYRDILNNITPSYCWRLCAKAAVERLPKYLSSLCNEIDRAFPITEEEEHRFAGISPDEARDPAEERILSLWSNSEPKATAGLWFFADLVTALFAMMDRHAEKVLAGIARTRVAEAIFNELNFASGFAVPVFIAGDSRFGKSVAHRTWCDAYPGRARLVSVPPGAREWDFYSAHADAFIIPYGANDGARKLARDVQFVIKHTGLFICYDEAHHLLPARVSRTSKPWRMDWIRCHVLDVGNAAAFIATRQTYGQSLAQFVKLTHHQMEQWFDRMNRPLVLPGEISRADVLAVAAHNFPTLSKRQLDDIAAEAMGDDSPFHAVNLLAKLSAYLARKAGKSAPGDDDVQRAIEEWKRRPNQKDFENPHKAPSAPPAIGAGQPSAPTNRRAAAVVQPKSGSRPAAASPSPGREISPVSLPVGHASLRSEEAPVLAD